MVVAQEVEDAVNDEPVKSLPERLAYFSRLTCGSVEGYYNVAKLSYGLN